MIRFVFTLPLDVLHTQVILKVFIFFFKYWISFGDRNWFEFVAWQDPTRLPRSFLFSFS